MKYKIVLNFFFCIFICTLLNISAYAKTFSSSQNKQITLMLNNFYNDYISEISKDTVNHLSINSLKNKYLTSNLQDKINSLELSYDPIIDAQDSSLDWLETLKIQKSKSNDDIFLVSYMDTFSKEIVVITLSVIEENKSYKINNILNMDRVTETSTNKADNQNKLNKFWYGSYNVTTVFNDTGGVGSASINYNILIDKDGCIFSGYGYRTGFEYRCAIVMSSDKEVSLKYVSTVNGDSLDQSILKLKTPLLTIIFNDSQFYAKSFLIYDSNFNTDIKIKIDEVTRDIK